MKTKNLLWFIFGPISTAGLSFFLVPLIAWIFPQEDIGRVSLLISISGFTTVLFCLGLDQAYVREFNEYKFRNKLFFNAIVPGLLAAIITFASILVIAPELISETIIGVGSLGLSVFAIIYFIVLFLTRFLSLTLRMEEKGKQFSISQILPKLVFAGVVFITALLVLKPSFYSLLIAHGLSLTATLIYLIYSNRSLLKGFKINNFFDKPQLSKMFSFGLPVSLSGILFWGLEGVDKLMLKYYSTYEELGLYSVTLSVAAFAGVLTNIFTTVWVPVVYKWISENINLEKIDEVITHIIIGGTCLVSLTGLFSWILKYLLPESYSNIHYLLPLCMLWPIFYAISEASGVGIAVSRKTKFSLIVSVVSLGVNVGLNMLLIPSLGAKGAAISLAVSFWFFLVLRTEFSAKLWRGSNKRSLFFWSTLLLLTSIVYGVLGSTIGLFSHLLWLILLGLMVYSFPNYFLLYRNKALQFINKLLSLSAKK